MILGVGLCIVTLRGLEYALLEDGANPDEASVLHFPLTFWLGEAFSGLSTSTLENLDLLRRDAQDPHLVRLDDHDLAQPDDGRGLAPLPGLLQHLVQARAVGAHRARRGQAADSSGKAITLDDIDDLDEDSVLGVGSVEDFSWKGILDFTSCTECGRCQSQCPAWNTEKPLSPKLLITALRDHAYAKAPYLQAGSDEERATLLAGSDTLHKEAERPLVGDTGDDWFYMPENGSAVIDPDVLWSCTSCGACVQQCPVDIEHVDHIIDMRRYQVLVESNFPAELNGLFKGLENKGNPWNMSPTARLDWAKGLDFEVKVVGETIESLDEVDWLFWVGCAGAYEDRAKKTTRAVAELLDMAGVCFGVLGNGETCTGDPARRAGNEFVFQGLAQQNVETFKEYKVKKVVSTCAHCFNTLKNEYKEFGVELEVVHHTQLLNRLVREGKLTPVTDGAGAAKRSITYHDPCYIGRHNGVYTPPRELLADPARRRVRRDAAQLRASFCCGAGGARMWMEENIGERINVNRTVEAVGTGADQIAVGCPFCRVMLSDGLTAQQAKGEAREEVEVLDVAQMLLASVKGEVGHQGQARGRGAAAARPPPATDRRHASRTRRPRPSPRPATPPRPRTPSPRPRTSARPRRPAGARRSSTRPRLRLRPRSSPAGRRCSTSRRPRRSRAGRRSRHARAHPRRAKQSGGSSLFDEPPRPRSRKRRPRRRPRPSPRRAARCSTSRRPPTEAPAAKTAEPADDATRTARARQRSRPPPKRSQTWAREGRSSTWRPRRAGEAGRRVRHDGVEAGSRGRARRSPEGGSPGASSARPRRSRAGGSLFDIAAPEPLPPRPSGGGARAEIRGRGRHRPR